MDAILFNRFKTQPDLGYTTGLYPIAALVVTYLVFFSFAQKNQIKMSANLEREMFSHIKHFRVLFAPFPTELGVANNGLEMTVNLEVEGNVAVSGRAANF